VTIQELGSLGELVAAIATVATLGYLGLQIRTSNRLARAEASRSPNSDLNTINGAFGTNPAFLAALRQVLTGAERSELQPLDRTLMDMYLLSVTNLQEQLLREVRAGIVGEDALGVALDEPVTVCFEARGPDGFKLPQFRRQGR